MIWRFHSSIASGGFFCPRLRGRSVPGFAARTSEALHAGEEPSDEARPLYRGSCLCGSVRYEVLLDVRRETSVRSVWEHTVRPDHFRLVSGEDTLSGHQFAGDQTQHFFCERCGLRSFSHHPASATGAFYSVDLKTLERTPDLAEMAASGWFLGPSPHKA